MARHCRRFAALGLLLWAGPGLPERAGAGELLGLLLGQHRVETPCPSTPGPSFVAAPPGPQRYSEGHVDGSWQGYGFGVPTYNWGYFGARYRPAVVCHKGYYGDYIQWGYRRGY